MPIIKDPKRPVQVPREAVSDKSISAHAFRVFCCILAQPENQEFSGKIIADALGYTQDIVTKAMDELVYMDYASTLPNDNGDVLYIVDYKKYNK